MNPTAHLLRLVGDQQLKYCPPAHFWPCQHIEAIKTRLQVLRRFLPVVNAHDDTQTFQAIIVWASNANETHAFSTAFSVS